MSAPLQYAQDSSTHFAAGNNISPAYEPTFRRRKSLSAAVLHIVNYGVQYIGPLPAKKE